MSSVVPDFSIPLISYRGEDTAETSVRKLQEEAKQLFQDYIVTPQQLPEITEAELRSFHTATNCHKCNQLLGVDRGATHNRCNLAYRIS